jgi:hypothetical protein
MSHWERWAWASSSSPKLNEILLGVERDDIIMVLIVKARLGPIELNRVTVSEHNRIETVQRCVSVSPVGSLGRQRPLLLVFVTNR